MGEDESMVMFFGGGVALVRWLFLYVRLAMPRHSKGGRGVRWPVYLAPFASLAVLAFVLRNFASFDVQSSPVYIVFYLVLGAFWTGFATWLPALLGLSYRDDVAERGNAGAAWAIAGAILGASLVFTGANIGDGPGWWVVFFTGGVALGIFAGCWFVLELVSGISETITVDRDTSAGVRLGALLVANGLILGRAAAGNWYGQDQAVKQVLQIGIAAVVLTGVAAIVERILKPTPRHPQQPLGAGVLTAVLYAGVAVVWLSLMGWWT